MGYATVQQMADRIAALMESRLNVGGRGLPEKLRRGGRRLPRRVRREVEAAVKKAEYERVKRELARAAPIVF